MGRPSFYALCGAGWSGLKAPGAKPRRHARRLCQPHLGDDAPDLKRLSCPPVRFPGLTLFHKRVPDAVALAFLMGHSWHAEDEVWRWDGHLKPNSFTTLRGGHLPMAGRIAAMVRSGALS
jgi:hypothetical protein